MAADIDVRSIANFASLPDSTVNNLLVSPSPESVQSFLQVVATQAKHCEEVKSRQTKLEVELETVVRTNESKIKVLHNSRDKALTEVSKLRDDLQISERTRAEVRSELESLQQSIESEATETNSLRIKINSLEVSHRDTLSLLDSKSKEVDRLAQDLIKEHEKIVQLRRESSQLEQAKQEATSAASSARFKQTSLEQEIDLQKKSLDWYENERKIKNEEHQKFRKEKNAKIGELQQSLDTQIDEVDRLRKKEESLKAQVERQVERNEELVKELSDLRDKTVVDDNHHRKEVDNLKRLAELQKNAAENEKQRVQELSDTLDETRHAASDEIGRIRAENQEEHNDREAAEQRVVELESKVSQLEAELQQGSAIPVTPRAGANGQMPSTPARPGTPTSFTPRSTHRFRNNMTTTQIFSEYARLEKELANANRTNEQLQTYVDSMLEELEASRPQIDEVRNDQARLQNEVVEMSQLADRAKQQYNTAKKETNILQGQFDLAKAELEASQQMCRDLGSQVRRLLLEQQNGSISDAEYARLVSDLDEVNQRDMEHLSDAQQNVNQYLIRFRNIAELQALNENQVQTIRDLVSHLESPEVTDNKVKVAQLQKDLQSANDKVRAYEEEIERMVAQTKSYVKERDMFRSMLTRRGHVDPTDFSRSMPAGGFSNSFAGERASPAPEGEIAKLLKDLQAQYDNFRREALADATTLKDQIQRLQQSNSELQIESSKNLGSSTSSKERLEMMRSNYDILKDDYQALQKRSNAAMESATRLEQRMQLAAEELVETKGMLDGFQRESANLKAEKDLWKSVEKRLITDLEDSRNERSRLDQLTANLQSLINEKEHSDAETRRRHQAHIESLDHDLQIAKRSLEEEIESKKQLTLQRNYDREQSQKRIDELTSGLSVTREELVAAKTTRDHLQARVDELAVELRSTQERLQVHTRPSDNDARQDESEENTLSREQQLEVEVIDLKKDLNLKSAELLKAEEHVEEYKSIAQEMEERLQQFTETNDEDKADLQASINEKDEKIKDLQQRIDDISSELNATNSELSHLRDEQAESNARLGEQRASLQAEIDRLKASEEKAQEQATLYLQASKEQQNIAEQRQQNYETELLKHTEAVKNLQIVRAEANQIRLELKEAKIQVQNFEADLQQKEASWSETESRLKQEVLDIKTRREEIEQHNKSLHTSLETVNTQLTSLQRNRTSQGDSGIDSTDQNGSQDFSSLNEVIKYLRQEKEIIEVRSHMNTLDLERTKRQLESTQSQLDEARLKLDQQQRATLDTEKNAINHTKLMETLNELNLHRESSVTLRSEKKKAEEALSLKASRVEELEEELIPLRARIAELENLLELKQGEIGLLQKDRDGWQQRVQNIMSKYDRIDPAELEELKNRVSVLETERDEAVTAQGALQTQVDGLPDAIEAARTELRTRLGEQFKARDRDMKEKRTQLQTELNSAKEELEIVRAENTALKAVEPQQAIREDQASSPPLSSRIQELEARVQELEAQISVKDGQIAALTTKQEEFKTREDEMKKRLNARLTEIKKEAEAGKQAEQTRHEQEIQDLKSQHQQELTDAKSSTAPEPKQNSGEVADTETSSFQAPSNDEERLDYFKNLSTAHAKEAVQTSPAINLIVKNNIRKQVEATQEKLSAEKEEAVSQALAQQADELKQQSVPQDSMNSNNEEELRAQHEAAMEELQAAFDAEKQEWQSQTQSKISEAKAATEKMSQGKVNLLKNQAAGNLAKINVVKKAAEETPDKPVKEVWDIAKIAKPPPADAPKPQGSQGLNATVQTSTIPAPATPAVAASPSKEQIVPATNGDVSATVKDESQEQTATDETVQQSETVSNAAPANQPQATRGSGIPQPASSLPRGNFRGRARGAGSQTSGIPRGGGVGNHVNTNIRGRGAGRAGSNATNSRGSTDASLNPQAAQFTPGKRPREDGADDGNMGKRIRGGGNGS